MRYSHLVGLAASLVIALTIANCAGDATAPSTLQPGPTSPQGPKATPPNVAPIANAGVDVLAECASHAGATLTLDGSASSDSDGQVALVEWFEKGDLVASGAAPLVTLGLGTHAILMRVTDDKGGTNDDVVLVTIQDTSAPQLQMTIGPTTLWPPNHTMRLVSSGVSAVDACDPAPTLGVTVTSDEPENGLGDGDTAPDWLAQPKGGTFDVWVRAERSGLGDGRVYTVSASAADHSGNTAARGGTVTVAHNQ